MTKHTSFKKLTKSIKNVINHQNAGVVKLVDARDSKSRDPRGHGGSIPPSGINNLLKNKVSCYSNNKKDFKIEVYTTYS